MKRSALIGTGAVVLVVVALFIVFAVPALTATQRLSDVSYTYNIQGEIVSIIGMNQPWKEPGQQFKYIVTVEISEVDIVKLSDAAHVLPELGPGLHSVPIPDSDVAGYIDWEASRDRITNPIDSAGVTIYTYELHNWVQGKMITLTCHEEVGSSNQAELVCSEF